MVFIRSSIALVVALAGCTPRGPRNEGAVPLTQQISIRPMADEERATFDVVDAMVERAGGTGTIEFGGERIGSNRFAPVDVPRVAAARREVIEEAVAAVREGGDVEIPSRLGTTVEREDHQWLLRFVDLSDGFDLDPGTLVKIEETEPGQKGVVVVFLTELDTKRLYDFTTEYTGRRISIIVGGESLSTPIIDSPVGGGTLWITSGDNYSPEELLARLVQ